ncbi:conserved transmembrane domain protein [Mycobacterium xenopi 4042]|uniref:Conserved transmembrane domain protein n=1 Tax=Mycobacterium xenopi 4042 TaxID=1299334 RepID=X7Z9Z3_MYCXE|nr:conserved transmembrane domain protein [Mycobacterium xenopi 4042]
MGWFTAPEYWLGRLILERGVAAVYLIAFVAAARQFRALLGEHGMLPIPRYLARQSFWQAPSLFISTIRTGFSPASPGSVRRCQRG